MYPVMLGNTADTGVEVAKSAMDMLYILVYF